MAEPRDVHSLRKALGCFPTGVAIVTTATAQGDAVGLTCNSFSSVSLEPPLVLWSLRHASRSHAAFRAAQRFAINVLAEHQHTLSARFASPQSSAAKKFEGVEILTGLEGVPIIAACVASFECVQLAAYEAGDHTLFIGRIERFDHRTADTPMVFCRGSYMALSQSLREMLEDGRMEPQALDEARSELHALVLPMAVARRTERDLAALLANVDELERLPGDQWKERLDNASRYFELISGCAHNEAISMMSRSLTQLLRLDWEVRGPRMPVLDIAAMRRAVVADLRNRDAEAARRAISEIFSCLRAKTAMN